MKRHQDFLLHAQIMHSSSCSHWNFGEQGEKNKTFQNSPTGRLFLLLDLEILTRIPRPLDIAWERTPKYFLQS